MNFWNEIIHYLSFLQRPQVLSQILLILASLYILNFYQNSSRQKPFFLLEKQYKILIVIALLLTIITLMMFVNIPLGLFYLFFIVCLSSIIINKLELLLSHRLNHLSNLKSLFLLYMRLPLLIFSIYLFFDFTGGYDRLVDSKVVSVYGASLTVGRLVDASIGSYFIIALLGIPYQFFFSLFASFLNLGPRFAYIVKILFRYLFGLIGVLVILSYLQINLGSLYVAFGGLFIGLGLGAQSFITNFSSSLLLVFEDLLRPGKKFIFDGETCTITKVGFRSVRLLRLDSTELIVPCSYFYEKSVLIPPSESNGSVYSNENVSLTSSFLKIEISTSVTLEMIKGLVLDSYNLASHDISYKKPYVFISMITKDLAYYTVEYYFASTQNGQDFAKRLICEINNKLKSCEVDGKLIATYNLIVSS